MDKIQEVFSFLSSVPKEYVPIISYGLVVAGVLVIVIAFAIGVLYVNVLSKPKPLVKKAPPKVEDKKISDYFSFTWNTLNTFTPASEFMAATTIWSNSSSVQPTARTLSMSSLFTESGDSVALTAKGIKAFSLSVKQSQASFSNRAAIISSVMRGRSYCGFHPHSSRAQLSSILLGQLSAMACFMGSGLYVILKSG